MIILVLIVLAVVLAGTILGRVSHQVESARDTEYVELEGHWVRYSVIGGGPPVLLVHGWLASSRIWEQLARRLAQRFTVYRLDLTGFGDSDKPRDSYGTRNGTRLLYSFCAHFGLSRAAVVGHDFSGSMAVKLAADHPDMVGRLVLVGTPADEEQIDLPTLLWLTTLPVVGPLFYSLGRVLKPVRKLWLRSFVFDPGDLPDEFVEDAGKSTPAAASKTFSLTRHEIAGGRVARQARIIKVPVLVVAGEDDQIIDPRAVSDWGQYAEQAEIALLDRCGHLPMVEQPSEFSARVLAFLTGDSRYLEYVKEVPSPAEPDPVVAEEEPLEETTEPVAPEDQPGEERTPEVEDERAAANTGTDFGDLSWDFSPKDSSTPRGSRSPLTPEREGREESAESRRETRESRRSARASTPRPGDYGSDEAGGDASEVRPEEPVRRVEKSDTGSARIPEFPDDLFQWSKGPDDRGPERRRRRRGGRDANRNSPDDGE
ncbi:hypothetical protein BH23ACT11_BH23ACT11_02680 [soil metagenome]